MKTFKNLKFKPHPIGNGVQGRMNFRNGYGVSVVRFGGSYTNNNKEWELAVFRGDTLCYDSGITSDVIGHLNARGVTKVMKQVQKLKKA